MNIGDLRHIILEDEPLIALIKTQAGLKHFSEDQMLCCQIGYQFAFNQIKDEMTRLDDEMGEAMKDAERDMEGAENAKTPESERDT